MNGQVDVALVGLKLALIPYAVAVLMPSWRWLFGIALVVGGLLSSLWVQDWIITSDPTYQHGGPGEALGQVMALIVTAGFATGVAVRGVTLHLRSRGLRQRYVLLVLVAGFAIVPGIFIVPALWSTWTHRPPSAACQKATFKVRVGGADFAIPASSMFSIYLGRASSRNAYYLEIGPSLRDLCSLNDNGKQTVKATHIWLRLRNFGLTTPALCRDPVPDWARTYCDAHEAAKHAKESDVDFAADIHVFAADEVNMSEFLGSRSSYEDSLHAEARPLGSVFIRSDASVSGPQLTFECTKNNNGYWCSTWYPWRGGATLGYSFQSGNDDVAARGNRIDVETRKFLSGLIPQH